MHILETLHENLTAWWETHVTGPDPAPGASHLDRLDGVGAGDRAAGA